ncbi:peptidylprolyl isomerase [Bacillus chungangensis]|uniref:Foldase protein PrsA n=1 Tax=Bacillus chungangensis TaxID=587633 RepID=A0ABT9WNK2_9BACI|nr:peptidylprolyl isomerase [Bacillus chungangensis]MDQ0174792.1 foldase protein PrsA [Bacillus chungangensis]
MKKWVLALSLTAGVIGLAACNNNNGEVIAETKAGNITMDELYAEMKSKHNDVVEDSLQSIVLTKVLSDKYKVTDKDVDAVIKENKEEYGDRFEELIQQSQFGTVENYKKSLELNLLIEKALLDSVKVTKDEVKAHYDEWEPDDIKVRHIVVEDEETAKEVKTKLDSGEKFEDLAGEYSTEQGAAERGGDLDWVSRGSMDPAFEEAAFKLKVDEISKPVQSSFGWHIIQVTDKKEKASFEDMKEEMEKEVKLQKANPQEVISKELKDANISVKDSDLKSTFDLFLEDPEKPEKDNDKKEDKKSEDKKKDQEDSKDEEKDNK